MFFPPSAMDARIHSRGYKRKRQQGETFGLCDVNCGSSQQQVWMEQVGRQESRASERSPSSVPNYVSEISKITDIYVELLSRLPALLSMEPVPHHGESYPPRRMPARRRPNADVLQNLTDLASRGVALVTRNHHAFATAQDRYTRNNSLASFDNGQGTGTGTHCLQGRNVDFHERQKDPDPCYASAPTFFGGVQSGGLSSPSYHPTAQSIIPSRSSATQTDRFPLHKALPDGAYHHHAIVQPSSISIDPPSTSHSAFNASTYGFGRQLPPESLRSSTGSSLGSVVRCLNCDKRETPEWRKGPYGPRTLCNACGLVWAKIQKRRAKEASASTKPITAAIVKTPLLVLDRRRNAP